MELKRKCINCGFEYEYEGFANLMAFCPECNSYDFLECEYGYGPVVPCRIYHGCKEIGMITHDKETKAKYRIDSDPLNIHQVLEKTYLEALHEARDILKEKIHEYHTEFL